MKNPLCEMNDADKCWKDEPEVRLFPLNPGTAFSGNLILCAGCYRRYRADRIRAGLEPPILWSQAKVYDPAQNADISGYVRSEMNESRAEWAEAAIVKFELETGTDRCDAICDLLADLMHFAQQHGMDFDHELNKAREHFAVERTGEEW